MSTRNPTDERADRSSSQNGQSSERTDGSSRKTGGSSDVSTGKKDGEAMEAESSAKSSGAGGEKERQSKTRKSGRSDSARIRANNVRKLRNERMMSKAELARRAGVSALTVDRVERGLNCRMDTKRKILEALGLKPQDRKKVFPEDD